MNDCNSPLQILTFSKTPDGTVFIDEKGTSIIEMSPGKGEVHLMHALGCGAMLKREGTVVIGQPGFAQQVPGQPGYNQHGFGHPVQGQHGYGQPAQSLQGYGQPSPGHPGFGSPSAPSAPYGTTHDGAQLPPPPTYNESKEKF